MTFFDWAVQSPYLATFAIVCAVFAVASLHIEIKFKIGEDIGKEDYRE